MELNGMLLHAERELQARIALACGAPHGSDSQRVARAKKLFVRVATERGITVDPRILDSVFSPEVRFLFPFQLLPVVAHIEKTTGRHDALAYICELAGCRLVVPTPDQEDAPNPLEHGCADDVTGRVSVAFSTPVEQMPERARKTIDSRKVIIDAYLDAQCGASMGLREFHNKWKAGHPDAPPYSTFARWMSRYREGGVPALADMRQLRIPSGPQMDARLRARFIELYLSRHRRSINYCVRLVNEYAADLGIDCPSPRTFGRLVGTIPHHIKTWKRFGRKARGDANR